MAYNTSNRYKQIIYSGGADNKLQLWFGDTELVDADLYCEKITRKARILSNNGASRFSLDNFVSQEIELVLHDINPSTIQDDVRISIGTLVDNNYEYVPIGTFKIQDTPTTDKNKITIKLRDNAVLFDFGYNAEPLIDAHPIYEQTTDITYSSRKVYYIYENNTYRMLTLGEDYQAGDVITGNNIYEKYNAVTKMQILQDICGQAGVVNNVVSFNGMNDTISIYDNTITARTYISYIAEQAGKIATIDRDGSLIFIDLSNLQTQRIPLSIVEKYTKGDAYKIGRVVFEDGVRKFENPTETQYDNLYINSGNPYISNQQQIDYIYTLLNGFEIDSLTTGKILGNPAIDPYDIIEIYDDYDENEPIIARTLANLTMTYNGVIINQFDTQINREAKQENISLLGEANFRKYAKGNIDNINNNIEFIVGAQDNQQSQLTSLKIEVGTIQSLFQITGGSNLIKNSQFLLTDEVWNINDSGGYVTPLGQGYNSNLIGRTTSIANIVMRNATINTKTGNISNIKINQIYNLHFYYSLDANTTATFRLYGANSGNEVYNATYTTAEQFKEIIVPFTALDTDYIIEITTSTTLSGQFIIYDLMLNSGDVKSWEPAMSEVYSTILKMSQLGLQVYASGSGTMTLLNTDGFKIYKSSNGEIGQLVDNFTNEGIEVTGNIKVSDGIKNGKWVEKDITISNATHHIEYMESD